MMTTRRCLSSGPVVLLARPFAPGNIGAAASAMSNFGMSELRIVQPQTPTWRSDPEAVAAAAGSTSLLDAARTFDTLHEATDDLHLVLATTARDRGRWGDGLGDSQVLSPRVACRRAADAVSAGQRVGLLFGSETNGLSREELRSAHVLVTVPTNPSFSSLNLAQAVLLLGHEYHSQAAVATAAGSEGSEELPATSGAVRSVLASSETHASPRRPTRTRPRSRGRRRSGRRRAPWPWATSYARSCTAADRARTRWVC